MTKNKISLGDVATGATPNEQEGLKLSINQQLESSTPVQPQESPSMISMSQPGVSAKPRVNINSLKRTGTGNRVAANFSNLPKKSEVPEGINYKEAEDLASEIFEPGGDFDKYLKEKTAEYTQYVYEREAKAAKQAMEEQLAKEDKDIDNGDEYEFVNNKKESPEENKEVIDKETDIVEAKEYKMVDIRRRSTEKEESMKDIINGSVQEFNNPEMVEDQEYPIHINRTSVPEESVTPTVEEPEEEEDYFGEEDYLASSAESSDNIEEEEDEDVEEPEEVDPKVEDILEEGEEIEEEYIESENLSVENNTPPVKPTTKDNNKKTTLNKKIDRITKSYMAIPSEDDEDEIEVTTDDNNDESINILKNEIAKKIKPVSVKMDITGFTVAKKGTASNEIFTIDKASFAKWPLPNTGIVVEMKEISGVNLETLRGYLERRNPDNRAALKIIYDHIVSPKPSSYEAWLNSIAYADFDNLFMLVYIAAFTDANFLPIDCSNEDCGKPYLTDNIPVMDLVKFKDKESEDKFWDLYNEQPTNAKGLYTTEIIPISDKFAIGLKEPSLYSVLIEPNYFNGDFVDKHDQTIKYFPYIDCLYWIDVQRKTLVPLKWDVYDNNAAKTARSRVRKYSKVLNTLTADQHSLIMSYINAINERADWFNYRLPETTCPHCGTVVPADDNYTALSLVFLRNRLAVLATT